MKKASRYRSCQRAKGFGASAGMGFTLVEMLVVVTIIMLLASIAAPAFLNAKILARKTASQVLITNIDQAVSLYMQDFPREPPPASDANVPGYSSAELLCFYMIGYASDLPGPLGTTTGLSLSSPGFYSDDGCKGYGFRDPGDHRGPKRGPYNDLQNVDWAKSAQGRRVFIDSFNRTVEYARYTSGTFAGSGFTDPEINNYAKKNDGSFFRKDFILMTSGRDNRFEAYKDFPETDDITNFTP
ncbi:MAG TPA: type II secretion system protein [Phycisphaerae bacterium]|nr:type II secretion system protein [Phycisphaerae bacterium]